MNGTTSVMIVRKLNPINKFSKYTTRIFLTERQQFGRNICNIGWSTFRRHVSFTEKAPPLVLYES